LEDEGRLVMKTRANGILMNYEVAGQGKPLALIHGAGDNLHMWYEQVPVFSPRFRVLTYDVRGFGDTELPESGVTMPVLADDLYDLLRALATEEAFVLGYSMGGRIGLQLALDHPETVKALVLANSGVGAGPRTPEAEERRRTLISLLERGEIEAVAEQMTAASFSPGFKERNPEAFKRYKDVKLRNDPGGFARLWGALATAPPPDLGGLSCPPSSSSPASRTASWRWRPLGRSTPRSPAAAWRSSPPATPPPSRRRRTSTASSSISSPA
jgi:pimeloyl-ACP methyl ester carboxylesterase